MQLDLHNENRLGQISIPQLHLGVKLLRKVLYVAKLDYHKDPFKPTITSSIKIDFIHLKCPSGHAFRPCVPHGLQVSLSLVSTTKDFSDSGVKPKSGIVEPKIAVTGAFIAEARCRGDESFTKFILACFMKCADASKSNFPARLKTFLPPHLARIS